MARERRDGGERSLLLVLLAIGALIVVSVLALVLTQGDDPQQVRSDALVASTTPVPSSGPARDQLLAQCGQLQAALKPITDFTVAGLASVPAGAPKPAGSMQVTCALTAKGGHFIAGRFTGTTAAAAGANITAAGWTDNHSEVNHGLPVTLYSQNGTKQISVVDLGGGQVVIVYS